MVLPGAIAPRRLAVPASFDCLCRCCGWPPTVSRGWEQPLESQETPLAAQAAPPFLTVSADGRPGDAGGGGDVVGGGLLGDQGHHRSV